ncbi:MAG: hypothetical protein IJT87_05560, partial [Ruminiclostridium sp.]|nr:hypothetical protein [Ruminiclostridium sp.]
MNPDVAMGIAGGASIFFILAVIFFYVLLVIADWKIFSKAGEAGWKSLIPIYNMYILFKIVYGKGIKFLLLLVPLLGQIIGIVMCFRLAQVFGKGAGFGVGMLLLPNIFSLILAFG